MINLNKNSITFLIILHLIANSTLANQVECSRQIFAQPQINNLSIDVNNISSNLIEKEINKEVKSFFKELEREIKKESTSYIPPKIKVDGLNESQNALLNDILLRNAKAIKKSKLYESKKISESIYTTPELVTRKYKIPNSIVNDTYKNQLAKVDPIDMGIFNVTTVVGVGTIIGVSASNTLTDPEEN